MIALALPYLTEADPEVAGEGSLDPLGLAPLAERLAEEIAPNVTARMARIRFVTAMAVSASVTQGMDEFPPGDGTSTPALAFEWHIVTALGRERNLPREAVEGSPGIQKARSAIALDRALDAASYLKVPTVFGFNGVYKRLAMAMGVVDQSLILAERGDELLRVWEREQKLEGFVDRRRRTEGGNLARHLHDVVGSAYSAGCVTESLSAHIWGKIVRTLRLDGARSVERKLLWNGLVDQMAPMRREVIQLLRGRGDPESEATALREISPRASTELSVRLDAVDAYEHVAELLTCSIQLLQYVSTAHHGPISNAHAAAHPLLAVVASQIPPALLRAAEVLNRLNPNYARELQANLTEFDEVDSAPAIVEAVFSRHETVQANKPPDGKRPWFEHTARGFFVRPQYRLDKEPSLKRTYVHPYRVWALRRFIEDLR